MARFGAPLSIPNRSLASTLLVEPTLGLDSAQPSVDAPLGSTPNSENFIARYGAIEPRPVLTSLGSGNASQVHISGGIEATDVAGTRYPVISSRTNLAWRSVGSWSVLSYVSAAGVNDPPALTATQYADSIVAYYAIRDENLAVFALDSYQSLYCWQANTTVFSSLTGAPKAKRVAQYDNFLIAFNVQDETSSGSNYVQRVQWSDRGSISSWTGGLSGFEDLLDMRGAGTRIIGQENRLVLFSDQEIWQGFRADFPFLFRFQALDRTVGCPYPWTVADTPRGICFMGVDYHLYLLPKEGGPAVRVGEAMHRFLSNEIDLPVRAFGVWDQTTDTYQLYYPVRGGSGYPQRALWLNLQTGSWMPQSFDRSGGGISLTRGFNAILSSSATSWGGLAAAGLRWADLNLTWAQLGGSSEDRTVILGTSTGTLAALNSNATRDLGGDVLCRWRSTAIGGEEPAHQKTITGWRVDYQTQSASSLTVRFSQNQGGSFVADTSVALPTASQLSQARVDTYIPARYPMFEVESLAWRYRLFRFWMETRRGGR